MYYVYKLLDYKGFPFYIGITKNLDIRIHEHRMHKNATPAKIYRVRKTIRTYGHLPYTYEEFDTKAEAVAVESEWIKEYSSQLVNKTHGKVKKEAKQRRSKGRSKKCSTCGNYFKRLGAHKCQHTR